MWYCKNKRFKRLGTFTGFKTKSPQQRNVVLHPEFINGQYAFYTRPQDSFIEAGTGGGIGLGLSKSMENAEVTEEVVIDRKSTIQFTKLKRIRPGTYKTEKGWLHLAHGVRNTAAGLRYVLYMFMTSRMILQRSFINLQVTLWLRKLKNV